MGENLGNRFRSGSVRYMIDESGCRRGNVHMVDDVAIAWDRRTFIKGLGLAVLTVQSLALVDCGSKSPPSDGKEAVNNLIIPSSPGAFKHVHDLLIPYVLLKTPPPEGVKLTTTKAFLHQHNIALTQKELITVNQGGTVTQKASSHVFVIALANGQTNMQTRS